MKKPKDYLHSDLLQHRKNDQVFQKTYNVIDKIAKQVTDMQVALFDLNDDKHIAELNKMNAVFFSDEIIDLVNYTIENFNKNKRL